MRLLPAAADGVDVTGALIVGLLLKGSTGSVAAATPGAGSGPSVSDTPTGRRAGTESGQRIRGDYQDIPNWQNLHAFDISPVSGDRCVSRRPATTRTCSTGSRAPETCVARSPPASTERMAPGSVRRRRHRNGFGIGVQVGGNGAAPGAPGGRAGLSDAELSELRRRAGDEITPAGSGRAE